MLTNTIHQIITFSAKPLEVYNLIMDSEKHSDFTGSEVLMSQEIKGTFSVFDGYCTGHNIELIPGKLIKQAWHFKEEGWPENHYSICTFLFTETAEGCSLDFTQTEVPDHKIKALSDGWNEYYWEAMNEYLESQT